jgi:hypothetical protein
MRSMAGSGRAMTWSGRRAVLMLDGYAFMLVTLPILKIKAMSMKLLVSNALTDCNTVLLATIPLILALPAPEGSGTATEFARTVGKRNRTHNREKRACWMCSSEF